MEMTKKVFDWIDAHEAEQLELLKTLAQIPAPSHHEEKRVAFCTQWLRDNGIENIQVDEAQNVICSFGVTDDNPLIMFGAHSDVVFPDNEPLPLRVEDGKIYCPGVGDDTGSVVALMLAARYITEEKLLPADCGLLIVINAAEEGLGNLKGIRKLMETYGTRVREFVSFDARIGGSVNTAVGSRRFKIEVDTEGGHSYGKFGNRNAIAYLASLIDTLYTMKVPEGGKTTYNVGTISGGTSVNTIAQHAEMLYEFRSDDRNSLKIMDKHLQTAIEFYRAKGVQVTVSVVGDRPCGGEVDPAAMEDMKNRMSVINRRHFGKDLTFVRGSTDCNIPLSMGIPALCLGCYTGEGAHTRSEYVDIASLIPGLKFAFDVILSYF